MSTTTTPRHDSMLVSKAHTQLLLLNVKIQQFSNTDTFVGRRIGGTTRHLGKRQTSANARSQRLSGTIVNKQYSCSPLILFWQQSTNSSDNCVDAKQLLVVLAGEAHQQQSQQTDKQGRSTRAARAAEQAASNAYSVFCQLASSTLVGAFQLNFL